MNKVFRLRSTIARPADATVYAAGDEISNSATAGSVVRATFNLVGFKRGRLDWTFGYGSRWNVAVPSSYADPGAAARDERDAIPVAARIFFRVHGRRGAHLHGGIARAGCVDAAGRGQHVWDYAGHRGLHGVSPIRSRHVNSGAPLSYLSPVRSGWRYAVNADRGARDQRHNP